MEETKQIDWACAADILEAAKPFDRSYDPVRPVMLAGTELVSFIKHHFAPRANTGRRSSDQRQAEKMKYLEQQLVQLMADNALLQSENDLLHHKMKKDRRQRNELVPFERRGVNSATVAT